MTEKDDERLSKYLTVTAAAAFLGVSPSTLRNWDRQGKLRARRHPINQYRLYRRDELSNLLKELQPEYVLHGGIGVQSTLFDTGRESSAGAAARDTSAFRDPAFASNKNVPLHRWVPWIAGFSAEFVRSALDRYLRSKGTVLDPFAGVGTTLVEAVLEGHDAIGFEINPYAALACKIKAAASEIDLHVLSDTIETFNGFFRRAIAEKRTPRSRAPSGFRTKSDFYGKKVLRKVLLLQDFIADIQDTKVKDLFRLAFASTMVTYSNYSYEPSLGRRVSAGKQEIEDFPVGKTIVRKLQDMAQDIAWMRERLKDARARVRIFNESFFECRNRLTRESVDLIITSPPYLNNYHYNRNTRPHLYWLGYVQRPSDMKPLEEDNFGKYWQTVRAGKRVSLDFELPTSEIADCLAVLRASTPEKGIYGGNGWANYAASYFNDCYRFAKAMKYVLKPRATALVVVGNSILQGVVVPTDRYLALIAEAVGLQTIEIHKPRAARVGNSIIQSDVRVRKASDSHRLYEAVVELRKR